MHLLHLGPVRAIVIPETSWGTSCVVLNQTSGRNMLLSESNARQRYGYAATEQHLVVRERDERMKTCPCKRCLYHDRLSRCRSTSPRRRMSATPPMSCSVEVIQAQQWKNRDRSLTSSCRSSEGQAFAAPGTYFLLRHELQVPLFLPRSYGPTFAVLYA